MNITQHLRQGQGCQQENQLTETVSLKFNKPNIVVTRSSVIISFHVSEVLFISGGAGSHCNKMLQEFLKNNN